MRPGHREDRGQLPSFSVPSPLALPLESSVIGFPLGAGPVLIEGLPRALCWIRRTAQPARGLWVGWVAWSRGPGATLWLLDSDQVTVEDGRWGQKAGIRSTPILRQAQLPVLSGPRAHR